MQGNESQSQLLPLILSHHDMPKGRVTRAARCLGEMVAVLKGVERGRGREVAEGSGASEVAGVCVASFLTAGHPCSTKPVGSQFSLP